MDFQPFERHTVSSILFVDMNSFFASCEQQDNYLLRGRPVGVCVYTSHPESCIISPSVEAKRLGIRTGMPLQEAARLCPHFVPIETNPERYRQYHVQLIELFKGFSDQVIPKSIDEAIIDLSKHRLMYKDLTAVAQSIKRAIRERVGSELRCSIGIAPNVFLAKLATEVQKPDGLVCITPETIDDVLRTMTLTDLPGIGERMAKRLVQYDIRNPLELRYASPERLRLACRSLIGWHWHMRLNFGVEVDLRTQGYKQMQAIRTVSAEQRASLAVLDQLLLSLCLTLERRMVHQQVFCRRLNCYVRYRDSNRYEDTLTVSVPLQDGVELYRILKDRMEKLALAHRTEPFINHDVRQIGVGVGDFVADHQVQYTLFEDNTRRDKLRKTVYELKARFGAAAIQRAAELTDVAVMKDLIGFGAIRDLHRDTDG